MNEPYLNRYQGRLLRKRRLDVAQPFIIAQPNSSSAFCTFCTQNAEELFGLRDH